MAKWSGQWTPTRQTQVIKNQNFITTGTHMIHCHISKGMAPCGLWGCKNRPAPFPGRISYKATKSDLEYDIIDILYLSML